MQSDRVKPFTLVNKVALPKLEKEMIRDFYHRTLSKFAGLHLQKMQEEVGLIVVGHLVPTLPFYLEALSKIGTIVAVITKSSSPDKQIAEWLKEWLPKQNDKAVIIDKSYFD